MSEVPRSEGPAPGNKPEEYPDELRALNQWVEWKRERRGKGTSKAPYNPQTGKRASVSDPATWGTFEQALEAYKSGGYEGLGFVFTENDPLTGLDLDNCMDENGEPFPEAKEVIDSLASYSEVSPSGKGIKIFVKAEKPTGGCRRPVPWSPNGHIEIYDRGRFFTMTGNKLPNSPLRVQPAQGELNKLHAALFLRGRLREAAEKDSVFARLFDKGDISSHSSPSEADSALLFKLIYYAGKDPLLLDGAFRLSALMRAKWDKMRGEETYGAMTIRKALESYKEPTPKQGNSESVADLISLADVKPEKVRWLWESRFPFGKVTLVDGDPGKGKTTLILDTAARVTTGAAFPDDSPGTQHESGAVLVLSAEDGMQDTIVPRLIASGADMSNVFTIPGVPEKDGGKRPLVIPDDIHYIRDALLRIKILLIVFDPLMAFLAGRIDSHRDQDVRKAMFALSQLAEDTGAAVVVIRHLNKSKGADPMYRGGGSIGIIGSARMGHLVARDPDVEERRVFAVVKSNLAAEAPALAFRMMIHEELEVPIIQWEGEVPYDATELLADQSATPASAVEEASEFLKILLADGPCPSTQIFKEAKTEGLSKSSLNRAKKKLGIKPKRQGKEDGEGEEWTWALP